MSSECAPDRIICQKAHLVAGTQKLCNTISSSRLVLLHRNEAFQKHCDTAIIMSANDSNEYRDPTPTTSADAASLEFPVPAVTHTAQTEGKKVPVILGYLTALETLGYLHRQGTSTVVLVLASSFLLAPIWQSQIALFFSSLVTTINKSTADYSSNHNLAALSNSTEGVARIKVSLPAMICTEKSTWRKAVRMLLLSIGFIVELSLTSSWFRCRLKRHWTTIFRFAIHCNALEVSFFPNIGGVTNRLESLKRALRILLGWFMLDIMVVVLELLVLRMVFGMEEASMCLD